MASMQPEAISEQTIVQRSPKLAQRLFEGEMLVITTADSTLHRFNRVGTFIWQMIEKPCPVSRIIKGVAGQFDASNAQVMGREITGFLSLLQKKGLIVAHTEQ